MPDVTLDGEGCPVCDWDGNVATTHDYDHEYYTHHVEINGEMFQGKTCSRRTKQRDGLLTPIRRWLG